MISESNTSPQSHLYSISVANQNTLQLTTNILQQSRQLRLLNQCELPQPSKSDVIRSLNIGTLLPSITLKLVAVNTFLARSGRNHAEYLFTDGNEYINLIYWYEDLLNENYCDKMIQLKQIMIRESTIDEYFFACNRNKVEISRNIESVAIYKEGFLKNPPFLNINKISQLTKTFIRPKQLVCVQAIILSRSETKKTCNGTDYFKLELADSISGTPIEYFNWHIKHADIKFEKGIAYEFSFIILQEFNGKLQLVSGLHTSIKRVGNNTD